jgi:hypothetical protein
VQAAVPCGHNEVWYVDREGAGEVDGVGATQGTANGQLPGTALDVTGQLDRPDRRPEFLPVPHRAGVSGVIEIVVAVGGCERGTDLGVRDPAR